MASLPRCSRRRRRSAACGGTTPTCQPRQLIGAVVPAARRAWRGEPSNTEHSYHHEILEDVRRCPQSSPRARLRERGGRQIQGCQWRRGAAATVPCSGKGQWRREALRLGCARRGALRCARAWSSCAPTAGSACRALSSTASASSRGRCGAGSRATSRRSSGPARGRHHGRVRRRGDAHRARGRRQAVTILCRRRGTVCPQLIDWLFFRPFRRGWAHDPAGDSAVLAAW